ncbi:MAG: AAA family ATPase [Acidobacteria bacterium]|nr:AAA family ATPase [Acidobacteriota bacterium]
MRDKLKQRSKKSAEDSGPAPLQPAYFNPEAGDPTADSSAAEPAPEASTPIDEPAAAAVPSAEKTQDGAPPAPVSEPPTVRRPRRRRGRGGRGRRSSGQPAPAPPVSSASATVVQPSISKGVVVLAVGLPGSGKSSWFKRHNINPLSSDLVRALLFDDPNEQRFQELVFSNLRSMLRARLIARRPLNYVDATNLTAHDRHSWIKLAKDLGYEVQAVYFDVPLEVCLARNQRRQRVVSEDVMRRMADKLKPPAFEEGFSKITVVRVKQREEF